MIQGFPIRAWPSPRGYGAVMGKWPKDWRPETAKDAQTYLDAHENGAGDPDVIEECERLVTLAECPTRSTRGTPPVHHNPRP